MLYFPPGEADKGDAMDIELFGEFGMVAKHGNLSEAARELNVTQPALSRHLSTLEKHLGVELFDRSTNPMQLTPEGEILLHWTSLIGNSYNKMLDDISELKGTRFPQLWVSGLLKSDSARILKTACNKLREEYPLFALKVLNDVGQTPFDLIREGKLDIAIEPYSNMIDCHGLTSLHLATEQSYVIMERSNPFAESEGLTVHDLPKVSFVSLRTNREHANRKHLQDICHQNGLLGDVPGNLEIRNATTFSEVLLAGLNDSMIMLPESIAKLLCTEGGDDYIVLPFFDRKYDYDIRVFYPKNPNPLTEKLIECLSSVQE